MTFYIEAITNIIFFSHFSHYFRATDIVKISLIPSHNAANVNNGIQNNAVQIDEQTFNKINISNKETTSASK